MTASALPSVPAAALPSSASVGLNPKPADQLIPGKVYKSALGHTTSTQIHTYTHVYIPIFSHNAGANT